jgi:hypothetical protein
MKRTDLAMVVLIAAISVVAAYFITGAILGDAASEPVTVQKIDAISTDITEPDPAIFNQQAINPTVEVQITPGNQ